MRGGSPWWVMAAAGLVVAAGGCGRADLAAYLDDAPGSSSGSGASSGSSSGSSASSGSSSGSSASSGSGSGTGGSSSGSSSGSGASSGSSSGTGGSSSGSSSGTGDSSSGSSSGTGGSSSSSGSSSGGPEICPDFGDACTSCASVSCPEIWCGCVSNPDCLDLFACTGQCGNDEICMQSCLTLHQDGISAALLVNGCAGTTCGGACDWGDPGFDPCAECVYTDCAAEMNACMALPVCGALYDCLDGCPPLDLGCQQGCYQSYGAGVPTLQDLLQCVAGPCQPACD